MGSEDYTTPSRGSLKLKGVQGSKVEKRKKKKRPKESQEGTSSVEDHAAADDKAASADGEAVRKRTLDDALESEDEKGEDREIASGAGKTEAEKRYQERRRKMLDDRLKKEGIKTHKERVEELNRYLSNLSEHHDMPRIGPG